jgi:hypothetical protein
MIGFNILFVWLMFNVNLIDLLDLRYNSEKMLYFIPSVRLGWVGKGETLIVTLTIAWLNLELNIVGFNFDYYYDKLEPYLNEDDSEK